MKTETHCDEFESGGSSPPLVQVLAVNGTTFDVRLPIGPTDGRASRWVPIAKALKGEAHRIHAEHGGSPQSRFDRLPPALQQRMRRHLDLMTHPEFIDEARRRRLGSNVAKLIAMREGAANLDEAADCVRRDARHAFPIVYGKPYSAANLEAVRRERRDAVLQPCGLHSSQCPDDCPTWASYRSEDAAAEPGVKPGLETQRLASVPTATAIHGKHHAARGDAANVENVMAAPIARPDEGYEAIRDTLDQPDAIRRALARIMRER